MTRLVSGFKIHVFLRVTVLERANVLVSAPCDVPETFTSKLWVFTARFMHRHPVRAQELRVFTKGVLGRKGLDFFSAMLKWVHACYPRLLILLLDL